MGGIGNLRGAVLGGLDHRRIQQISDNREEFWAFPMGVEWTPGVSSRTWSLIMVFRPQGLIGEETREAG